MRRRMLVKAETDDQGKLIFGDDPRHSRHSEVAESIEQARRAQQENEQRHDVQLEIPLDTWLVGPPVEEVSEIPWASEQEALEEWRSRTLELRRPHFVYLTDCDPGDENDNRTWCNYCSGHCLKGTDDCSFPDNCKQGE